jgi:hypothetical protein
MNMEHYNNEYDYGDSPIYTGDDHLMPQQTVQNAMQVNMMGYQQIARGKAYTCSMSFSKAIQKYLLFCIFCLVSNAPIMFASMHPPIITSGMPAQVLTPVMGTMANIVHVQQPQQLMQQHQLQGELFQSTIRHPHPLDVVCQSSSDS